MSSELRQRASPIRVAIVEDQREFRENLASLIDGSEGYRCRQRFGTMEEALEALSRDVPDVVLLDIGLPGMSGIEGVRLLNERCPHLPVLMLTVYNDDERIFEAMCASACGYLLKKTPKARILECIQEVLAGGAPMSPEVARRDHQYKTAAGKLGITINTVSSHMRHIYEKLQVHSKSEAVAKAFRQGLIR